MDNGQLRSRLEELAEPKYREFSGGLIPGVQNMLGVRIPVLRGIAKEIAKGDWQDWLKGASDASFEEVMLQGMVIGYAKMPPARFQQHIREFVPKIDNWSVNDCVCATLKMTRRCLPEMWEFLAEYRGSDSEFALRFFVVMLMDYYLTDDYIDRVLDIYGEIRHEGYYVKMAVAWGVAGAYSKYPVKTDAFLQAGRLEDETERMAVRKICESFRVSREDKERLREMVKKERNAQEKSVRKA